MSNYFHLSAVKSGSYVKPKYSEKPVTLYPVKTMLNRNSFIKHVPVKDYWVNDDNKKYKSLYRRRLNQTWISFFSATKLIYCIKPFFNCKLRSKIYKRVIKNDVKNKFRT